MQTPWGKSDWQRKIAVGINWYSTPSHGGVKLSVGKNKLIPEYMRNKDGWYEEDCDWAIPYIVLDDVIRANVDPDKFEKYGRDFQSAVSTLKSWKPFMYEKWFDVILLEGESHVKDRQMFEVKHFNSYVAYSAVGHDSTFSKGIPEGMVGVRLRRESDGLEVRKLVNDDEYQKRSRYGFVIESWKKEDYDDWVV